MDKDKAKEVLGILKHLKALNEVDKIRSTFIPAFEQKTYKHKDSWNLHGNFKLGGTVSGRLSSSNPNLMNLPSTGTAYAKQIKQCFKAPKGYLMVGADFNALEMRVNALLTQDPNKLSVYTHGYDSHCMNSYAYFKEQMPDITEALTKAELPGKFFKVTHDDGTKEYLHESDPRLSELRSNK
jgi:DNA polymerase-1